ncbi:MAG: NUDIX domain-containing protein [bacterium]
MTKSKILNDVQLIQKAIITKDDKILALKRTAGDDFRAGCWDLPGGRYEEGEDVIAAIKREIMEEVGFNAKALLPIRVASGLNFANGLMSGRTVFAICYICHDWEGQVTISSEHTEFRWVTPQEFMSFNFGSDGGFFVASMRAYMATPPTNLTYSKNRI